MAEAASVPWRDAIAADVRGRGRRGGEQTGQRVAVDQAGLVIGQGRIGGAVTRRLRIGGDGERRRGHGEVGTDVAQRVVRRCRERALGDGIGADVGRRGRRGGEQTGQRVAVDQAGLVIGQRRIGGAVDPCVCALAVTVSGARSR